MIVQLSGVVLDRESALVTIDCYGVGYGVTVLPDESAMFKSGSKASLYIYEHIKEDAHDLYGFLTKTRRELFMRLLSVNGVGPKVALSICGLANEAMVRSAIAGGDVKFIASASGVGRKVAERVVVDLKNKVGLDASSSATVFLQEQGIAETDEALQALIGLGYSRDDAVVILSRIDPQLAVEDRVKLALKG